MRPTIDETMMEVAKVLAKRGTCMKKQVGCVAIDKKGNIISTGYNGQPRNTEHCDKDNPCKAYYDGTLSCNAIHAEANMLMRCSDVDEIETVYITEAPCDKCKLAIKNTSCRNVVYFLSRAGLIEWVVRDEEQFV